jgi:MFS family permease
MGPHPPPRRLAPPPTHPTRNWAATRGRAFAVYGAVVGGGGSVGLLLGGVLTSYASWRWCLYVNLIFAAVSAAGGLLLLSNPRRQGRPVIAAPGVMLACAGLFALVFGFSRAERSRALGDDRLAESFLRSAAYRCWMREPGNDVAQTITKVVADAAGAPKCATTSLTVQRAAALGVAHSPPSSAPISPDTSLRVARIPAIPA